MGLRDSVCRVGEKMRAMLGRLSFRTGVIVLALCVPCYVFSFAQAAIPGISPATKGVLWAVFFGLAKAFQYGGLTILGVDGWKRVKNYFGRKKRKNSDDKTNNIPT